MNVSEIRSKIKDVIAKPVGGVVAKLKEDSLALLESGDSTYCNKHMMRDLMDMTNITAMLYDRVDKATEGMGEVDLRRYMQTLARDGELEVTSDMRVESNNAKALAKNVRLVLGAALDLGSDKPMGFAEQAVAMQRFQALPEVMATLAKTMGESKGSFLKMGQKNEATHFLLLEHAAMGMGLILGHIAKDAQGEGPGKVPPKPKA